MPPKKALILGIGNPLRGDDRLGWVAAERLRPQAEAAGAEVLCVQQLSMDLVETVAAAARVLFLDAKVGQPAGQLEVTTLDGNSCLSGYDSHFFDPATLLAAVQALYGGHPPAMLLSLRSTYFEFGETLSPDVEKAIPVMVARARAWLNADR